MAQALSLEPADRRLRMAQMRRQVSDYNVYRWGASILADSLRLRDQMQLQSSGVLG